MGGDDHYEIPLSELKPGTVKWPSSTQPRHSVHVVCVGRDFVAVNVTSISRNIQGPKRLYAGEKWRSSYMFGEWSYGYALSLEWVESERPLFSKKKSRPQEN